MRAERRLRAENVHARLAGGLATPDTRAPRRRRASERPANSSTPFLGRTTSGRGLCGLGMKHALRASAARAAECAQRLVCARLSSGTPASKWAQIRALPALAVRVTVSQAFRAAQTQAAPQPMARPAPPSHVQLCGACASSAAAPAAWQRAHRLVAHPVACPALQPAASRTAQSCICTCVTCAGGALRSCALGPPDLGSPLDRRGAASLLASPCHARIAGRCKPGVSIARARKRRANSRLAGGAPHFAALLAP